MAVTLFGIFGLQQFPYDDALNLYGHWGFDSSTTGRVHRSGGYDQH